MPGWAELGSWKAVSDDCAYACPTITNKQRLNSDIRSPAMELMRSVFFLQVAINLLLRGGGFHIMKIETNNRDTPSAKLRAWISAGRSTLCICRGFPNLSGE